MWADTKAIAAMSALSGDEKTKEEFLRKASLIKRNFQEKCWDPKRDFFFHRFQNDEDGGIKANTLTHETGKYVGSPHGREAIGYIPWYFNVPDTGFEAAWKYLIDPAYCYAPFGTTTVEKNDPMYSIAKNCCAWSGNAWPFATSQTLKAMANVLKNYTQTYVNKADYWNLLRIFSLNHPKDGFSYIAEANHPETGFWDGQDVKGHSEHYFHSTFADEIITGLMGFTPKECDSLEVNPLLPDDWDFAALDNVAYHGHNITILWDRYGNKYNRGKGLSVFSDGELIGNSSGIIKITLQLPKRKAPTTIDVPEVNYAVNNEVATLYSRAISNFPGIGTDYIQKINDGQYWYYSITPNRWSNQQSSFLEKECWVGIDFGVKNLCIKLSCISSMTYI